MLVMLSSATAEPVTVEQVKAHLRITTNDDDLLLENFIISARSAAENYMKRQIMPVQWRVILDTFPGTTGAIELPRPPLSTASTDISITYFKDSTIMNDSTTVASTSYTIDYDREPGCVYPSYGNDWPDDVTDERKSCVFVNYKSGYATVQKVPEPIKLWIKMKVGSMYEFREPISESKYSGEVSQLRHEYYNGLLDPYVIVKA